MIDLHCHLLPGIDDGPESLEQALELARHAVASGITHARVTPHIHPERYDNDLQTIGRALELFQASLEKHRIPLATSMAAEVRLSMEILSMIAGGKIPFLGEEGGFKVMLLEFPHSHILPGTDKMVAFLLKQGIRPMIAHPERNKDVIRDFSKIVPFVEQGCLLQVTAGAVAGGFGRPAQERAIQLLEKGWVTILASDAHNIKARPPELEAGRQVAAKIVGEEASWELVRHRPARIIGLAL